MHSNDFATWLPPAGRLVKATLKDRTWRAVRPIGIYSMQQHSKWEIMEASEEASVVPVFQAVSMTLAGHRHGFEEWAALAIPFMT
jgi:hypothetical protein